MEGKESDIELSVEELEHIAAAFNEMGVKPKADSASDFKHWFQGNSNNQLRSNQFHLKQQHQLKPNQKGYQSRYIPRIVPFSGSDKDESYDLWKVVMREIEQDQLPNNKKTAHIKMAQSEGEYTELKSMMQQMNKDIGDLKRHTQEQLQRQDETRTEGQYQQSTHNNWNTQYRGRGHRGHRGRGQGNRNYRPYWDNTQNTPLQAAEAQQQTRRNDRHRSTPDTPTKHERSELGNNPTVIDHMESDDHDDDYEYFIPTEVTDSNNLAPVDLTVDQPLDDSTGTEEDASPSVDEDTDDPVRLDYDANAVEPEVNTSDENPVNQNIDEESDSSDEPTPRPGRRSLPARTTRGKLPKKYDGFMMQQSTNSKPSDWLERANFLSQAVSSGLFQGMEQVVTNAILKIVTD
ncbi:unnamed protein product [Mytilus coruscus]|uniref:Uncharacterized protein n=1 Tax=Mytilus coruscus TaxID=42192 RepID=A0A6J8B3V0_MYTCO|nr:unnamed protein product [Mytilus coruscus]